MTQEEKELLLKDLSARLPYGVIVRHSDPLIDNDGNETGKFWYKRGYLCDITTLDDMTTTIIESEGSDAEGYEHICFLEKTVPYLRPLSSMTKEERDEYDLFFSYGEHDCDNYTIADEVPLIIDWLNKKMFDYRGLIKKGLAIEVTEENNPYKN